MKPFTSLLAASLLALGSPLVSLAQTTAFTYQGFLTENGGPANSVNDFEFRLFDGATAGAQQGATLTFNDLGVTNGLFTVTLDFGASPFTGADRWLNVAVRPGASVGSYTNLTPRQPITSTPYAVRAAESLGVATGAVTGAMLADGAVTAAKIGGVLNPAQIPGLNASQITSGNLDSLRLPNVGNWDLNSVFIVGNSTLVLDPTNLRVGIRTNSPARELDVQGRIMARSTGPTVEGIKTGTGTFPGVAGVTESTSADASGVRGFVTSTNSGARSAGVQGRNFDTGADGYGVRGIHDGSGYGVHGEAVSGRGVSGRVTSTSGVNFGVYGQSDSINGIGVYGFNDNTNGVNYGVYGITASGDGAGIYGLNTATNSGTVAGKDPTGVSGQTSSRFGVGVRGEAISQLDGSAPGVLGITRVWGGDGIRGEFKAPVGSGYGSAVAGYNYSGGGWAGYFVGRPTYCDALEAFRLGVRRTAVSNELEVEGTASKTSSGSWLANSDARIKQEVQTVTSALETLSKVRLVNFRYTDDYLAEHPTIEDRRYLNVIAQEFAQVFPEHVKSSGEKLPDGSDILQVDIHPLTIYSAAAVQELDRKVDAQRQVSAERIHKLENENAELKQRLDAMEKLLHRLTARPVAATPQN